MFSFVSVKNFNIPTIFRFSLFLQMSAHQTKLSLLLSRSSFKLQSHFQRAFSQSTALHGTTDEPSLWRFGSLLLRSTHKCSTLLSVSVGIFPLTFSPCCRWTYHCAFSSFQQRLLLFNTHSNLLGLRGLHALCLSGSDSWASACPVALE